MNVKISHEIPISIIDEHQDFISDYMFVLLHKILEDKEYDFEELYVIILEAI